MISKRSTKKRVNLAQVAASAQVSQMTVSRFLNGYPGVSEQNRERIEQAIQSLGYVSNPVARSIRGTSNVIAVVVSDVRSYYMSEVLHGVTEAAHRLHYGLMLHKQFEDDSGAETTRFAMQLCNGLADGALLIVPTHQAGITQTFSERKFPYVSLDQRGISPDEISVTATDRKGIHEAMRHLILLGHERIAFITGLLDIKSANDRLDGYKDGLTEAGLPFDPALIREGTFSLESGFVHTRSLLQETTPPTAIVASNDLIAFGVYDAVKTLGLQIGRDISVVGFDDSPMAAQVYPPLTTVRLPMVQIGEEGVEVLVNLLQGRALRTLQPVLPTELVIRSSTGRVPR